MCEQNIYVTTKVDINPGEEAPTELCTGYHQLVLTLKYNNKMCVLLSVLPLAKDSDIVDPYKIPTRMSALMRHFTETSIIKGKCVPCG